MVIKICFLLLGILFIHSIYFTLTGLFVFFKNKTKFGNYAPKTKFAVLVAARNEGNVIGNLVGSLMKQNYPKELYDVYTLVNNSTDDTLEKAKSAGSKIIEVDEPTKTKGEVLSYSFRKLKDSDYDAYIVFDADNVVDKDFLKTMNNIYASGYKIAQGRRDSLNSTDNWISSSYSIFYYIQNLFYNYARTKFAWNATINGTGFMADKKFVEDYYHPCTITEDIELALIATLHQERVVYTEEAITYDEQPTNFKVSWIQRVRWSKGIMDCTKHYSRDLLKQFIKTGKLTYLDKVLFLTIPHVQVLSFILTLILAIAIIIELGFSSLLWQFILSSFMLFGLFIGILFNAFILKYYDDKVLGNWHGILLFGLFVVSWVPINIVCFFKKSVTWKPIEHGKNKKKAA